MSSPEFPIPEGPPMLPPVPRPQGGVSQSLAYVMGRRVASNAIRLVALMVVARYVPPDRFGLVAFANVALSFAVLVGSAGIGTFVVCTAAARRSPAVMAAFWLNLALTTVQVAIGAACLPLLLRLQPDPRLPAVFAASLAVFFIDQLRLVPDSVLEQEQRFRAIAARDLVSEAAISAVTMGLAVAGWDVWSLVLPRLAASPVLFASTVAIARWKPRLKPGVALWPAILRFTAPLMGSSFLQVASNDADTMVVGAITDVRTLGLYSSAYNLSNVLGRNITATVVQVATPVLAADREEPSKQRERILRLYAGLALVVWPPLLGLFVLADAAVSALYGPNWAGMVPYLRVFLLFTMVRATTSPSGMVFNVLGRTLLSLQSQIGSTLLILAGIALGASHGALGIAVGLTVARITAGLTVYVRSLDLLDVPAKAAARLGIQPAVLATACALAVWASFHLVRAWLPNAAALVCAAAVGGTVQASWIAIRHRELIPARWRPRMAGLR